MINWLRSSTEILFNPRLSSEEKAFYTRSLEAFSISDHIWVATSGSTGRFKWVALSKEAILASADAVNCHLQAKKEDVWLHALPDFHVGGIGIWARAFLSEARVVPFKAMYPKWDSKAFLRFAFQENVSLTALVPAQVYDLVTSSYQAPPSLKATVVGGGALTETLYREAERLGWKLLPSYGLTECASQVATAFHGHFDRYQILSHMNVKVDEEKNVWLKSSSLLTAYALIDEKGKAILVDPKEEGWFQTEDKGEILPEEGLRIFGRGRDFVKVGGESVNLLFLQRVMDELAWELKIKGIFVVIALQDERLGSAVHLVIERENFDYGEQLLRAFNKKVLPYERIREMHWVEQVPLTPLGKIDREALKILAATEP